MPRGTQRPIDDTDGSNRVPRKAKQGSFRPRAEFAGWINASIPFADKDKVSEFGKTQQYADAFEDVVRGGHKITVSYDDEQGVFVAASFQTDTRQPTAGLMVSQRSDAIWRALLKLIYVHSEILPADYSGLAGGASDAW